jgi:NNP family nitrate/nitrite transporter-like MFS transporter
MKYSSVQHWDPENKSFWDKIGKKIAVRNLVFSVYAEFLAFTVWQMWSIIVIQLPGIGFDFSVDQLFWLAAVPGLTGATLRIPYALMVPIVGGRNWTIISSALLLLPTIGLGIAVQNPDTSYMTFFILALLCGFGGGNFASSMTNINPFFPKRLKGMALGINAAGGNIGVSVVQFIAPVVITLSLFGWLGGDPQTAVMGGTEKNFWLQNIGFIWVPLIIISIFTTLFFMDNLHLAKATFKEQIPVLKHKHSWLLALLYLGTFGSFIGYSAGFPLLIKSQFTEINPLQFAFLGPLVGAAFRPIGGMLADKLGGARLTFWNFLLMTIAALGVVFFLGIKTQPGAFTGFFIMFLILFITAGIGNGSVYRMIPIIFHTLHHRKSNGKHSDMDIMKFANKETGVAIGLTSAIGAYGAFFIPQSYGTSIALTGSPKGAIVCFALFYLLCMFITWHFYYRKNPEVPC